MKNSFKIGDCDMYWSMQHAMQLLVDEYDMKKPLGSGRLYGAFHISGQKDSTDPSGRTWNQDSAKKWIDKLNKYSVEMYIGWYVNQKRSPVYNWDNEEWGRGSVSLNFMVEDNLFHLTLANDAKYFTIEKFHEMRDRVAIFF